MRFVLPAFAIALLSACPQVPPVTDGGSPEPDVTAEPEPSPAPEPEPGVNPPATGEEGGACYANGACNTGLVCNNDVCEAEQVVEGGEGGVDAGQGR